MTKNWSLASRLTLWFGISAFLLVFIATVTLYWSLTHTLNVEDSLLMSDKIQTITNLLNSNPENLTAVKERVEKEWVIRKFERVYVKVLDHKNHVITETPGFEDIAKRTQTGSVFKTVEARKMVGKNPPHEWMIQIALDRTREESFLATYRSRLLMVLLATLIITSLIGRRIVVKGIGPVFDIAEAAKNINSTTLHERINLENLPMELIVLANTFNEMLDRLNDSFERLSRFSADIAHDLRTPINNLQGELEVSLGKGRTPEEYQDVLGSCLEECARISTLIDSLLFLARSENPSAELRIETINVKKELLSLIEFFEASTSEKGIKLNIDASDNISLHADRALLQRAIGNLISNAMNFTKKDGIITISARASKNILQIVVRDTGVGIPVSDIPKVFDRFYRVDPARSAKSGGSGLGLSIVKGIMLLHRGKVEISSELEKGTAVTLTFTQV